MISHTQCCHHQNVSFNTENLSQKSSSSKSGIYEITCKDCTGKYIGQTYRRFIDRMKEHRRAFKYKEGKKSAIAQHCIDEGHEIEDGKIIKEVKDTKQLDAWESLYIHKGKELVNIDEPLITSNLFKYAL